ncbi:MAG: hypothetical protein OYG32_17245 [Rhodospirillaceae bacterium]|nr:hypothetical protein [Rhodospirillaceae bacterium]MDE0256541.1 hypothetical protein [Rhodospirillaceae bacterium]MDE0619202.1 hypothetical protein [Rhodospirillaceae bacterium]
MTDQNRPNFADVFSKLNRWRHLPGYRLEPNLAPFFGLFLPDILGIGREDCTIIPEFPLRKGTLCGEHIKGKNQSVKTDYVVFSKDSNVAYFVELKTDSRSFDEGQLEYLRRAKMVGPCYLLEALREICLATTYKKKYAHLLFLLANASIVKICNESELERAICESKLPNGQKWENVFKYDVIVKDRPWTSEIVYITPTGDSPSESYLTNLDFCKVSSIVENRGSFGPLFANYLRKWTTQAGNTGPRKIWATE